MSKEIVIRIGESGITKVTATCESAAEQREALAFISAITPGFDRLNKLARSAGEKKP